MSYKNATTVWEVFWKTVNRCQKPIHWQGGREVLTVKSGHEQWGLNALEGDPSGRDASVLSPQPLDLRKRGFKFS
jgi:hypothetical protein